MIIQLGKKYLVKGYGPVCFIPGIDAYVPKENKEYLLGFVYKMSSVAPIHKSHILNEISNEQVIKEIKLEKPIPPLTINDYPPEER